MGRLDGKEVIITAAGQGIGKATAITFHNEGANVTATDINENTLSELNKEYPKIKVKKLDSTKNEDIKEFINTFSNIDVLFNAVGFVHHGTILDCEEKDWDFSFDTNIKSLYFMCKATLPTMINNNGGSIINVASVASSIKGLPNRFVYGASKAAVVGLTKSVAADFINQGIRCNAICPGLVDTPMIKEDNGELTERAKRTLQRISPDAALIKPEQIADNVVWLCSESSMKINGQSIVIDGGGIMR